MSTIQRARRVLQTAEESLRQLMHEAMAEQRYAEIKDVADLANGIALILRGDLQAPGRRNESADEIPKPAPQQAPKSPPGRLDAVKGKKALKSNYPRFARSGERLVKIGWSKKNKKEYEHRVPREVVTSITWHLISQVTEGKLFEIEPLLTVMDPSGQEIPAYQIYVTIAWLREARVVEKKGRDGYVLTKKSAIGEEFDETWNSLPATSD